MIPRTASQSFSSLPHSGRTEWNSEILDPTHLDPYDYCSRYLLCNDISTMRCARTPNVSAHTLVFCVQAASSPTGVLSCCPSTSTESSSRDLGNTPVCAVLVHQSWSVLDFGDLGYKPRAHGLLWGTICYTRIFSSSAWTRQTGPAVTTAATDRSIGMKKLRDCSSRSATWYY